MNTFYWYYVIYTEFNGVFAELCSWIYLEALRKPIKKYKPVYCVFISRLQLGTSRFINNAALLPVAVPVGKACLWWKVMSFCMGPSDSQTVGMATRLRAGKTRNRGSIPRSTRYSCTVKKSSPSSRDDLVRCSLGVKRPGRETDQPSPSDAELKN